MITLHRGVLSHPKSMGQIRDETPSGYLIVIQSCLVGVVVIKIAKLQHGFVVPALLDVLDAQFLGAQERVQRRVLRTVDAAEHVRLCGLPRHRLWCHAQVEVASHASSLSDLVLKAAVAVTDAAASSTCNVTKNGVQRHQTRGEFAVVYTSILGASQARFKYRTVSLATPASFRGTARYLIIICTAHPTFPPVLPHIVGIPPSRSRRSR